MPTVPGNSQLGNAQLEVSPVLSRAQSLGHRVGTPGIAAFGGGEAQQLGQFAQAAGQASNVLGAISSDLQEKRLRNDTIKAYSTFATDMQKVSHEMLSLKGSAAADAVDLYHEKHRETMQRVMSEYSQGVQERLMPRLEAHQLQATSRLMEHARNEIEAATTEVSLLGINTAIEEGVSDPAQLDQAEADILEHIENMPGLRDTQRAMEREKHVGALYGKVLDNLSAADPDAAIAFFSVNRDKIPVDMQDEIFTMLTAMQRDRRVLDTADAVMTQGMGYQQALAHVRDTVDDLDEQRDIIREVEIRFREKDRALDMARDNALRSARTILYNNGGDISRIPANVRATLVAEGHWDDIVEGYRKQREGVEAADNLLAQAVWGELAFGSPQDKREFLDTYSKEQIILDYQVRKISKDDAETFLKWRRDVTKELNNETPSEEFIKIGAVRSFAEKYLKGQDIDVSAKANADEELLRHKFEIELQRATTNRLRLEGRKELSEAEYFEEADKLFFEVLVDDRGILPDKKMRAFEFESGGDADRVVREQVEDFVFNLYEGSGTAATPRFAAIQPTPADVDTIKTQTLQFLHQNPDLELDDLLIAEPGEASVMEDLIYLHFRQPSETAPRPSERDPEYEAALNRQNARLRSRVGQTRTVLDRQKEQSVADGLEFDLSP